MKLSAVVFSSNSASTLEQALKSVAFADEVVAVDAESTDESPQIAKQEATNFLSFPNPGYVEPLRVVGITQATGDWILVLDGDEEIGKPLAEKIRELMEGKTDAWWIPRKNLIFGEWMAHAGWWPDYQLRLFRKGSVEFLEQIHAKPTIKGKADYLPELEVYAIVHHNYQTVEQYIDRLNRFTSLESAYVMETTSAQSAVRSLFDDFFTRYYLNKGYAAGDRGVYVSLLQGFYQFCTQLKAAERTSNLSTNSSVDKELDLILKDFLYWRATYKIDHASTIFGKILWKIRRYLRT